MKSEEKTENSYLKNENSRYQVIHKRVLLELLVRRSNRKDFFSKECITSESLEKNHYSMKFEEKTENSYLKNENSRYQVIHKRVLLELLVRRSNRKDFFSKECVTSESLEKNHYSMKFEEKTENSYLKNENSCYQVMHERVFLELLVRRSTRRDFFSKECITSESLEKNHFSMKS